MPFVFFESCAPSDGDDDDNDDTYILTHMQAYDQHLNMVLGNVEETINTIVVEEQTGEQRTHVSRR